MLFSRPRDKQTKHFEFCGDFNLSNITGHKACKENELHAAAGSDTSLSSNNKVWIQDKWPIILSLMNSSAACQLSIPTTGYLLPIRLWLETAKLLIIINCLKQIFRYVTGPLRRRPIAISE